MTDAEVAKELREERLRQPKRERRKRWAPPTGWILLIAFIVALGIHYFGHSWAWSFAWGFASFTGMMFANVFDAIADVQVRLDFFWWSLFGGIDGSEVEHNVYVLKKFGDSGALNDLMSRLDALMDGLEEIRGRHKQ